MKNTLFHIISWSTYALIIASDSIGTALIWLTAWTSSIARWAIANGGQALMRKFTPEQFEEVQGQLQLRGQQTELELLATVSQLKEDAINRGDWTDGHTEAIEAIGNALVNECDWDEEHVHQYLKEVVESIPGLTYGQQDDED